jgi:hypothetical protein
VLEEKTVAATNRLESQDPVRGAESPEHGRYSCMNLTPKEEYRCSGAVLHQICGEKGLDTEKSVRVLRDRVVRQMTARVMENKPGYLTGQASAPADVSTGIVYNETLGIHVPSNAGVERSKSVLLELDREVPPSTTEEPEAILWLISHLHEFFKLQLVGERNFVIRVLPPFSGSVLRFFGGCSEAERVGSNASRNC